MILSIIAYGLAIYLGLGALLYLLQQQVLYHPRPVSEAAASRLEPLALTIPSGPVTLAGWLQRSPGPSAGTVVYFGGNAEELSTSVNYLAPIGDYHFVYVNYRGFGGSGGNPEQTALTTDAVNVIDYLARVEGFPVGRMILIGRSLGSGIAIYAASQRPIRALVLLTPYDSIAAVGASHYPIFPVKLLLRDQYPAAEWSQKVAAPALVIAAANDQVIPRANTQALIDAWPRPIEALTIAGTNHNDLVRPELFTAIRGFLARVD